MQSDTANTPVGKQAEEPFTEGAVKSKIKFMVSEILNRGMFGTVYTTKMLDLHHSFSQLNMTDHDKNRLIMQCEEYYNVDLGLSCVTFKTISDLVKKVLEQLTEQGRMAGRADETTEPAPAEKAETTEVTEATGA